MIKFTRSYDQLNWAYLIPPQVQVAACVEGGAGIGKTETVGSLAHYTSRNFYSYELSRSQPEDFQGFPCVSTMTKDNQEYKYMEFIPDERILRSGLEPSILLLDEITNVVAPKQAAALNLVQNPPAHCWMFMACNPIDIAADGQPLTCPFVNRIWFGKWEMDEEAQDYGLTNDLNFPPPSVPIVPPDYMEKHPRWGSLIVDFLKKSPVSRHACPKSASARSEPWASPRQWTNLSKCLAAAECVGADESTITKLVYGLVGDGHGKKFMTYLNELSLPDPRDMLDDVTVLLDQKRYDVMLACLSLVVSYIKDNPGSIGDALKFNKALVAKNEELSHVFVAQMQARCASLMDKKRKTTFQKLADSIIK